ncbi:MULTISPECIES: XTP/dITP diphosphatase [Alteromonadaceae]|uniref:XTP/dITP diphosphatase n=1 Tax=Alteromonadaceae TaxID=72275 RepID=UPI001C08C5EC|nr:MULTISPECIES: XTP/dITP diphosphatase [Aliiglaciecola]MBU2877729.1 XTP/dITP diphosphatase [Aliiglaciecola lipolytica]MDO6713310.1 XTP/dITP diphosphatase [Aliiglaciecola sp. 2_MG-2023]MDO6754457.1 XTP/dITP diphosphatase [Aliiglaciecola sp. 1_MG-2023]
MSNQKQKIVLATGNKGKVREFERLLANFPYEVVPQSEFDLPEAEETGTTFVENAIIKARHAAKLTGLPAIADDSGLAVDALGGAPGVYSSRYAAADATDQQNVDKLLTELEDVADENRSARFLCVIVFMQSAEDPTPIICQGEWHGHISQVRRGEKGFGYDPVFWVSSQNQTAAQLPAEVKNRLSHRGKAMSKLLASLSDKIGLVD